MCGLAAPPPHLQPGATSEVLAAAVEYTVAHRSVLELRTEGRRNVKDLGPGQPHHQLQPGCTSFSEKDGREIWSGASVPTCFVR